MPYCDQSSNGIRIFYRRCGHGSTKVLLIIGLAGTHDSWGPQIKGLTGAVEPNDEEEAPTETVGGESNTLGEEVREGDGIEVCCFDNRGVGRSSVPTEKSDYTTTIMAEDALALLDHLGWKNAHVFGHSMGAMIACKLAAMAPDRICSLALLNVTGGGFECFPKIDLQMLSLAFRFLRAKTPEQRAMVDLETHYTKEYLDECVGSCTRRDILYQDYVKAISSSGMQSNYGFEGQLNACWTHNMTSKELETIRSSGDDIIAQLDHARRLAKKLQPVARMVELHGAHLVSHERPEEVNLALMELIKASKSKLEPEEWSHLAESESDEKRADKYESKRDTDLVT
ncbi:hydrolase, alpha beta fold family domain containing protein [Musa troglodytarum]|uniref:Hydrolase, alpha beta fold family domain containing protein n=1 Tax=Musa troglodytarum TaxID=320322 RepID=A0A9E7GN58_9LILI|nr:hydrolase, alpha beta fold family domain containing protein [Musa troglodytarum]